MEEAARSREEVFEYSPPEESPAVVVESTVAPEKVDASALRVGEAFQYFEAASRGGSSIAGYEAPRAKLARLQREAADLRRELEATPESFDGGSFRLCPLTFHRYVGREPRLRRRRTAHEPRPPQSRSPARDSKGHLPRRAASSYRRRHRRHTRRESTFVKFDDLHVCWQVKERSSAVSTKAPQHTKADDDRIKALGGGPETERLLAEVDDHKETNSFPAIIVQRLADLRSLHDDGFQFTDRLRAAEQEQASLRTTIKANDDALKRLATAVNDLLLSHREETTT